MANVVVSDIDLSFIPDPDTKDLKDIYQVEAVNQSIDLFISNPYRIKQGLTNNIFTMVFSDLSYADSYTLSSMVSNQIVNNYRILDIISLVVEPIIEKRKYYIKLVWRLKNTTLSGTYERYWEQ